MSNSSAIPTDAQVKILRAIDSQPNTAGIKRISVTPSKYAIVTPSSLVRSGVGPAMVNRLFDREWLGSPVGGIFEITLAGQEAISRYERREQEREERAFDKRHRSIEIIDLANERERTK